ncbi:hypothetical protein HYC85_027379 [Camellia sinensis]|uniref:FBD domain-containing protein n=1 Tax=Camellia sinensis TaxID=4442 RepID=A0A7J7G693_CAMSI|nr:hypothetical protein HYC85_027379 [Camellia sinensis]
MVVCGDCRPRHRLSPQVALLYDMGEDGVSGPSFKLKYLEIGGCFCLRSIDIYDANLMSFKCSGLKTDIAFKNTLHLVKASFDGPYARYIVKNFIQVSSHLLQLETLVLNLSRGLKFRDFKDSTKETKIRGSKHLHKSLKEMVIDPSRPNKWAPEDPDKQQLARTRARQHLETRLPFGTQLVLR